MRTMVLSSVRVLLTALAAVAFAAMAWTSLDFPELGRYFPLAVGVGGAVLAVGSLLFDAVRWRKVGSAVGRDAGATASLGEADDVSEATQVFVRTLYYLAWMLGFIALIWLAGILLATPLFLVAFLSIEAGVRWRWILVSSGFMVVFLYQVAEIMTLYWPRNLLGFE